MPKVKHEDCEDAIADTFFSLKKVVESGKQIDNMEEYCKRAIKNRLLRIIGKQKYAINIDDVFFEPIEEAKEEDDGKWKAYEAAWRQLSEPCQQAFKKYYYNDEKGKDIWHSLGFNTYASFRQAFKRCKTKFKKFYEVHHGKNAKFNK